jgi:hypothetical protein
MKDTGQDNKIETARTMRCLPVRPVLMRSKKQEENKMTYTTGYQKIDMNMGGENWKKLLIKSKKDIIEAFDEMLGYIEVCHYVGIVVATDGFIDMTTSDKKGTIEELFEVYEEMENIQVVAAYTAEEAKTLKNYTESDKTKWVMDLIKFQAA